MRDILVISIVVAGALAALRRPWIGVMLWTWLSIMNPHRFTWGIAYTAPLAAVAAGSTLVGLLFTSDRQNPFQGRPVYWLALFSIWITINWLFGFDPVADYPIWDKVIKVFFMTFIALTLLVDRSRLMMFAWVTIGSMAFLSANGGFNTIVTGGSFRVWGPPGSFIADNNDFALATTIVIPMVYFLYSVTKHKWVRYALLLVMALSIICVLGTHSRGGFLALLAMGMFLWSRSSHKLAMGLLVLLLVSAYLPTLPDHWWDRMESIQQFEQDPSAMGRINAWIVAWETAKAHPFGVGMSYQHPELFQQFGVYETNVRAAHSIYFQILGNHGFVGLFLYLGLWVSTYRSAGWLRKNANRGPDTQWAGMLGSMVQVSLVGFAVGGAFLSLSYFDLPFNLMVMVVLARVWAQKRVAEQPATETSSDTSGDTSADARAII
jgi:probable O-glycosylation ligase (exosortase A-associated)